MYIVKMTILLNKFVHLLNSVLSEKKLAGSDVVMT